jgi:serine/threonine protein kinase
MITPSGEIVLIDFGAANQYLGNATGTIVGKQFYISPEQFRGKATPASDIYSLGGTIFFLLTGIDPDALAVAKPARQRSDVSTTMNELVARCTALDEKQRFGNADDLIAAIDAISAGVEDAKSNSTESSAITDSAARIILKQEEKIYR